MATILVPLTHDKFARVDAESAGAVLAHKWSAIRSGERWYAIASGGAERVLYMHRLVADAPDDMWVDHRNGDGLDNVRANLRLATPSQNAANAKLRAGNKTGFKGVSFCKATRRWRADITVNGRTRNLGRHATPEEAATAYDRAAAEHFGEFARLNGVSA